jgi:AAA15 family ATPase/GTPase
MPIIRYVEIGHFKTFSDKIMVEIGHPAVLIGPNNSGKTSVIQALILWSQGVKTWYEKKGDATGTKERERYGAGVNRLSILDIPVPETRFFWSGTKVRNGNMPVEISVSVGLERNGNVKPCRFIFTYQGPEMIYAKPDKATIQDNALIQYASNLNFSLLYPISGILSGAAADTEEAQITDGRINVLLGQGQTAQVLRNICYKVAFDRGAEGEADWEYITGLMNRLFMISLNKPEMIASRGSFRLTYKEREKAGDNDLEISLAGRGAQQVLLILAYLFWHKKSVILVDEPDAHLEILRQKQIYAILNSVAERNGSQVIISTHSEVILDEAIDTNLTLLLNNKANNLASDTHLRTQIQNSLQNYGIEHYYNARINPRVLILEGSTDKEILTALALQIKHEAAYRILTDRLNVYYTKKIHPEYDLENKLDIISGAFRDAKNYFYALSSVIDGLKALAIYDNDNLGKRDEMADDFAVVYWKDYEIENYFISPEVLLRYAAHRFSEEGDGELFSNPEVLAFKKVIKTMLLERVFNNSGKLLDEYERASVEAKKLMLKSIKMSDFAEEAFRRYAKEKEQPMLLVKGEFYRLVPFCPVDEIPEEVREKLDLIVKYIGTPDDATPPQ